ncbi:MAG: hypothetical protein J0L60_03505 [Ignavibacteria bacterium]|nr:hypothetical protein [Ignavibacteria bacterium]
MGVPVISTNIHPSSREGVVGDTFFLRTFIPLRGKVWWEYIYFYEHSSLFEGRCGEEDIYFYEHSSLFEGRCGGNTFISTNIHPSSREGVVGDTFFLQTFIPLRGKFIHTILSQRIPERIFIPSFQILNIVFNTNVARASFPQS